MGLIEIEKIKSYLDYNPTTGVFCWIRASGRRMAKSVGVQAGSIDTYGYLQIRLFRQQMLAHRLAWYYMMGIWPEHEIDHKDGNTINNKWENLRASNRPQQMQNARRRHDNKSGFKGVYEDRRLERPWCANISANGRRIALGRYYTPEEAGEAYAKAALLYHGEFACLHR